MFNSKTTVDSIANHTIAGAAIFGHCTKRQIKALEQYSTSVRVMPGVQLTKQGSAGSELGVVIEGIARVEVNGEAVASLQAGDHYGELTVLAAGGARRVRQQATITADTALWVAVMSVVEFDSVLRQYPEIGRGLRTSFTPSWSGAARMSAGFTAGLPGLA